MTNINLSTKPLSTNDFKVWGLEWKHVQMMINPIQKCKWVAIWSHWSVDPWRSYVCSKVGIGDGRFINSGCMAIFILFNNKIDNWILFWAAELGHPMVKGLWIWQYQPLPFDGDEWIRVMRVSFFLFFFVLSFFSLTETEKQSRWRRWRWRRRWWQLSNEQLSSLVLSSLMLSPPLPSHPPNSSATQ